MRFVILACILEASYLRFRFLGDLKAHSVEAILTLLIAGLFYLVCCYFIIKDSGRHSPNLLYFIFAAALFFRLTVWPLFPALSDDPFRYRWEGKLQAFGGNPYSVRPNDPQWSALHDQTFAAVAGKDFKAVYGPLAEITEFWTYRTLAGLDVSPLSQVFWFKLPYAICDLGAVLALWRLLVRRGVEAERVLIYAWSPLPITEFWATGHNDAMPLLFILLALLAAASGRWLLSFSSLSLAIASKVWPALLLTSFVRWKRWRQLWVVPLILLAFAWPYRTNIEENARFLTGFIGGWRNNDSLFGGLLWLAGDPDRAKKIAFAIVTAVALLAPAIVRPLERAALVVLSVTLMISANCHPWYLTWIVPLLAFNPVPALLLWTTLAPLAHSAVIAWVTLGEWHGSTSIRWLEYVPVYGLLAGSWLVRQVRARRRCYCENHDQSLPPVFDAGAGCDSGWRL